MTGHLRSDGQGVTLLVGLGLELAVCHRRGECHGALHPAHFVIDACGRPRLRPMTANVGVSVAEDVMALLRLGVAVSEPEGVVADGCRRWLDQGLMDPAGVDLRTVLTWLLSAVPALPLGRPRSSGR